MFKIVQRYLALGFIPPFFISAVFFIAFLLTSQLFRIADIVINKDVELKMVLMLVGHIAMSFVPMAAPLSVLFAAIFALNKLSDDSEIVAMRSFGVSKFQIFLPFLILGLFIAGLVYTLNQNIVPYSKSEFKNTVIRLGSKEMLSDIKAERFFTDIPLITIFANKVTDKGKRLEDVFIHLKDKNGDEEKVIFAKRGTLIKKKDDTREIPNIRLRLDDGNISKTFKNKPDVEKILFAEYDFPLISGDFKYELVTKDSMRTSKELLKIIIAKKAQFEKKLKAGQFDRDYVRTKLEFFQRINTPIQCILFILLGFALGIRNGRSSSRNSAAISLIILISYYAVYFTGISFASKGLIIPEVAIFFPSVATLIVGLWYYIKLDWLS